MSEEILACFDEQGNEIDPQPRSEVLKMPRRWWCGAGNTYVVNRAGKILCSKRSDYGNKPNCWQALFGGHVKANSSFIKTAQAELEEESGLHAQLEDLVLISKSVYEPQKYFHQKYLYVFEGDDSEINIDMEEVSEFKWLTFDEYNSAVENDPSSWTNHCPVEDQQKIKNLL